MIRRLNKDDLANYYDLRLEMLKLVPTAFGMSYEDEKAKGTTFFSSVLSMEADTNVIFGAFLNNQLVGSVGVYSDGRPKSKHKAMIWGMYVQEKARGQGLGKKLIASAIDHAQTRLRAIGVYLAVESTNAAAKSLYIGCGFKVWGTEPAALFVNGVYYDECHMYLKTSLTI